jgi:hypothetical protein
VSPPRGTITSQAGPGASSGPSPGEGIDFELVLAGGTSEDVPRWLSAGQFGLWQETGRLNDIIREAARRGEGLGEAVGRVIEEERFENRDLSLASPAGARASL